MVRNSQTAAMLAVVLLAAGCANSRALTQGVQTQIAAPSDWRSAGSGTTNASEDLSRWWQRFDDPTLADLITTALRSNPDIRTARARLRQARAQQGVAEAALLPSVSTSANVSERKNGAGTVSGSFDASWEPDIFGGTRAGVDAAAADVRATVADLNATHVSLAAEVARNYMDLRTQQKRLSIARESEATQAETLELTDFRAQAGLVSRVDVEQARANLEQTRAQLPSLESGITQSMHRLATLAGLQPAALRDRLDTVEPIPQVPSEIAAAIPAVTLRQRPDVEAAEERILAETARLNQSKAQRWPQFSLNGSLGTQFVRAAVTGGTSLVASAATSVFQTIFDGGRIRQQIEIQSAAQEQAVVSYERVVLTALEEVENALVTLEKSRQRLDALNVAVTAATNAAQLAQTQYQAGLTDFQRVLDTQRTVLSVQDSIAQTQGERVTGLVQLYKALGGGWSRDVTNSASPTANTIAPLKPGLTKS